MKRCILTHKWYEYPHTRQCLTCGLSQYRANPKHNWKDMPNIAKPSINKVFAATAVGIFCFGVYVVVKFTQLDRVKLDFNETDWLK
jgi:hypothetical protein